MSTQLTLYTSKGCPFAIRVALALEEAGAEYQKYIIDLQNKPEWYARLVNPASKVPALTYGGPHLFPIACLLPPDPVLRAQARFFIDTAQTQFNLQWHMFFIGKQGADELVAGAEALRALLPDFGFAVGDYSIADADVTPFVMRVYLCLKFGVGAYTADAGKQLWELLWESSKFARLRKYYQDLTVRQNYKAAVDETNLVNVLREAYGSAK